MSGGTIQNDILKECVVGVNRFPHADDELLPTLYIGPEVDLRLVGVPGGFVAPSRT